MAENVRQRMILIGKKQPFTRIQSERKHALECMRNLLQFSKSAGWEHQKGEMLLSEFQHGLPTGYVLISRDDECLCSCALRL